MKKILLVFWVAIFVWACDNEVDLTSEWKDIPVVYGLLSTENTDQFVRIEKAFLDPVTSALIIAQNSDSLYYDNLTVRLRDLTDNTDYNLERVDGNQIGYVRAPGIFADDPNFLYRLDPNLNLIEKNNYEIRIDRGDNKPLVTAVTSIVEDVEIIKPKVDNGISFVSGIITEFKWKTGETAHFFELAMRIHYQEAIPGDPNVFVDKFIDWQVEKGISPELDPVTGTEVFGDEFFSVIKAGIQGDPLIRRRIGSVDLIISAGGEELDKFLSVALANTGITGSQELPTYTNLSEGVGIFSSRNLLELKGYPISATTRDSLVNGSVTGHINWN